jgi:L-alanine-DL-glutamate epimerase-like enolase superfamily enzyme
LALAKSESPRLNAVKVTENGGLIGLGELELSTEADEDREVGIILIAQLLAQFLTFLFTSMKSLQEGWSFSEIA